MLDPGRLANNLETLVSELFDWTYITRETEQVASNEMRLGEEAVVRADRYTRISLEQLATDQDMLKKAKDALQSLNEHTADALSMALDTFKRTEAALLHATNTLNKWEEELVKAKAWLARAEARLVDAYRQLQNAQADLSSAQSELRRAESALSACQSNKDNNCGGLASAVSAASARVSAARRAVLAAEAEVRAAQEEVAAAKHRVAACSQAVDFAREAVTVAREAKEAAHKGVDRAERSVEHVVAADKALHEAFNALGLEEEAVNAMISAVRLAFASRDEALFLLKQALYHAENAQRVVHGAVRELGNRITSLRDADRADLYESRASLYDRVSMQVGNVHETVSKVIPFVTTIAGATMLATSGTSALLHHIEAQHSLSGTQTIKEVQASRDAIEHIEHGAEQVFEIAHTVEEADL